MSPVSRRVRAAGAATVVLALAAASLSPLPDPATTPGPQPAPTGAELDGRAYAFLRSDHEREREELAERATRDHRPTAAPKPTKTKPKAHAQPQKKKAKKRPATRHRARTYVRHRATAQARVNGSRARTVINFALAQVGKPYRWASDGPGSYDCSGLVKAAFARVGLNLPHQTGQLVGRGRKVSRAAMQPGDIVFPSSGHVGIYLGGGKMVHAPKPGDHVRVAALYGFWTARRLL